MLDLTQAYETLRERVLSPHQEATPGLAVFLQQGMVAWMEICAAVMPVSPLPLREPDHTLPIEIVTVMAQMVLNHYEEVPS